MRVVTINPNASPQEVAAALARRGDAFVDQVLEELQPVQKRFQALEQRIAKLESNGAMKRASGSPQALPAVVRETVGAVGRAWGVSFKDIMGTNRTRNATEARMVAMWLVRRRTQMSYPEIGRRFKKDHSTVQNACRRVAEMRSDSAFETLLQMAMEGT